MSELKEESISNCQSTSYNKKWEKIIKNQQQEQQTPFLLKQQGFKYTNQHQQYSHQQKILQQSYKKGRQLLINKQYELSTKQLSKTLMAFEFIMKNHMNILSKQQIKQLMLVYIIPSYNNLSLCYLKLKNYQMVETFTNQILGQNQDNVKARYRRALAEKQLKKYNQAINDFQIVMKIDKQMQEDCKNKINQCKLLEIQEKNKQKKAAKKFLSGYQHQDRKINLNQNKKKINDNNQKNKQKVNFFSNSLKWIKEKCQKCSNLFKGKQKIKYN